MLIGRRMHKDVICRFKFGVYGEIGAHSFPRPAIQPGLKVSTARSSLTGALLLTTCQLGEASLLLGR